eukprot:TRINITY_DN3512_c0_g1_i1.p1 TRINITY_DN3512_c0_g1~~TRINITY_DN3512_c0_g1_i1.p1  ORF type:complete len:227 (+),score=28.84 TRINITY_DN3512_c0_g1_i1:173-853(+)
MCIRDSINAEYMGKYTINMDKNFEEEKDKIEDRSSKFAQPQDAKTKRAYTVVSSKQRKELLDLILKERVTIKNAAERLNMNYSNAKSIVRIFSNERRIEKVPHDLYKKRKNPEQDPQVTRTPVPKVQTGATNLQGAAPQRADIHVQSSTEGSNNNYSRKSPHFSSKELARISFNLRLYTPLIQQSFEDKLAILKRIINKYHSTTFRNEMRMDPSSFSLQKLWFSFP